MTFDTRRLIVKRNNKIRTFDAILSKDKATGRKFYTPIIHDGRDHVLSKAWKTRQSAIDYAVLVQARYVSLLRARIVLLSAEEDDAE